jgi:hypothetical protein
VSASMLWALCVKLPALQGGEGREDRKEKLSFAGLALFAFSSVGLAAQAPAT